MAEQISKVIGRLPVYQGDFDSSRFYLEKNRVTLYGSEFESLEDNNNTPPAILDEIHHTIAFNTAKWKIISNGSDAWLAAYKIAENTSDIEELQDAAESAAYLAEEDGEADIADFDPQADTVWNKPQTLSNAQKAQARQNISAASKDSVDNNIVDTGEITYTEVPNSVGKQFDDDGKLVASGYLNRKVAEISSVQECIVDISSGTNRPSICFYDATMNLDTVQGLLKKITLTENFTHNLHVTPPVGAVHMVAAYLQQAGTDYFGLSVKGVSVMNNNAVMQEVYKLTNVCYVSASGSDSNKGTKGSPFLTFQHAIDNGYKNIYAIPGNYGHQKILVEDKNGISIKCLEGNYSHRNSYLENHWRQGRVILDNSVDVDSVELDSTTGLYTFSHTFAETSNWYKVFITEELPVVRTGLRSTSYWAILWEMGESIAEHKKLIPVLSISDCQNTTGSFYYDGTTVYIHPNGQDISKLSFKYLYDESDFITVGISNSKDITIEGFDIYFGTQELIRSDYSIGIIVRNCDLGFSVYSGGEKPVNSDSNVYNCNAFCVCADGFAPAGHGVCNYYNCCGYYNGDDGISHHDGCIGVIDGGMWEHNGKGGVSPAHGSNVNVMNVCSRYNGYGLYLYSDEGRETDAVVLIKNNTFANNRAKDMIFGRYNAIVTGCIYGTKQLDTGAVITEIGNTVLT